jgi:hypothetical protein
MIDPAITTETWDSVREEVKRVNPRLYNIIQEISPNKSYVLLKAHYPFGQKILDNGELILPSASNGSFIHFSHYHDPQIKKLLNYSSIPVGLLLNKACEIFIETSHHHILPLKYIQAGSFFGLFEYLNKLVSIKTSPVWCITAGARSLFMLPSISEKRAHKRISYTFHTSPTPPHTYEEQWDIFRAIAQQSSPQWKNSVLFFSDKWFEHVGKKDKNWNEFYLSLFEEGWRQLQFVQSESAFNSSWNAFSEITGRKDLNPRTYIANTIKYLIAVTNGAAPAFKFATDNNCGPLDEIYKAYKEVYQLEKYAINFMHPYNVIYEEFPSLYYSMNTPILIESRPKGKYTPTAKDDLREISHLLKVFTSGLAKDQFPLLDKDIFLKTHFNYFHVESDPTYHIQSTAEIPHYDKRIQISEDEEFSSSSSFLKGCLRIYTEKSS